MTSNSPKVAEAVLPEPQILPNRSHSLGSCSSNEESGIQTNGNGGDDMGSHELHILSKLWTEDENSSAGVETFARNLVNLNESHNENENNVSSEIQSKSEGVIIPIPNSINSSAEEDDWDEYDNETRYLLEDYRCPICLDTLINTVKVDCNHGHKFCNFCIQCWIRYERQITTECPVCRGKIYGKTLDLKTDAEIRGAFNQLSEKTRQTRLLSIKDRLQLESRQNLYNFSTFIPSEFYHQSTLQPLEDGTREGGYHDFHYQFPYINGCLAGDTNEGNSERSPFFGILSVATEDSNEGEGEFDSSGGITEMPAAEPTSPPSRHATPGLFFSSVWNNQGGNSGSETTAGTSHETTSSFGAGEVRYQHYQHQNQQESHSRWNNNLYLTPEDTSSTTYSSNSWQSHGRHHNRRDPSEASGAELNVDHPRVFGMGTSEGASASTRTPPPTTSSHFTEGSYSFVPTAQSTTHHHNHSHNSWFHASGSRSGQLHAPYSCIAAHSHSQAQQHCSGPTSVQTGISCGFGSVHAAPTCSKQCQYYMCPQMPSPSGLVQSPSQGTNPYAHAHANCGDSGGTGTSSSSSYTLFGQPAPVGSYTRNHTPIPSPPTTPRALTPRGESANANPTPHSATEIRNQYQHQQRAYPNQTNRCVGIGAVVPPSGSAPGTTTTTSHSSGGHRCPYHSQSQVSACPVWSNGSFFTGGFPLYSSQSGFIGFHISHHIPPAPVAPPGAGDGRVISQTNAPGRITHPIVSLFPLSPDGSSARVSLTFEVHSHRQYHQRV